MRSGLVVSALVLGKSGLGSRPRAEDIMLCSRSASLYGRYTDEGTGTDEIYSGGNPSMD